MTQEEFFKRYTYSPSHDHIGGGTFGSVYKAYDNVLHREVAIKVSAVKTSSDGKKTFSLKDEFEALNHVPKHPNIANYEELYSFEMPNGIFDYAVMQYYPDGDLSKAIKQGLSLEQKEDIATQLLEGIDFLHKHKVVHRDLKPGNILVVKHKGKIVPLITDFGLSKAASVAEGSMFSNSFGGGTPRYSSPEQLQGQPLRFNTDLWSYGAIIYELFTGEKLFFASSGAANTAQADMEIYNKIVRGNVSGLEKMPEKWRKVAERCLVVDAEKRVKNAVELFGVIMGTADDDDTEVTDPSTFSTGSCVGIKDLVDKDETETDEKVLKPKNQPRLRKPSQSKRRNVLTEWMNQHEAIVLWLSVCFVTAMPIVGILGFHYLGWTGAVILIILFFVTLSRSNAINRRKKNKKEKRKDFLVGLSAVVTVFLVAFFIWKRDDFFISHDVKKEILNNGDLSISVDGVSFVMKPVDGDTFVMGTDEIFPYHNNDDQRPAHNVIISSFYMSETEVTQRLWKAIMGELPETSTSSNRIRNNIEQAILNGGDNPICYINWKDAIAFISKLNRLTKLNFRLPTEAEWEYAARGGKRSKAYRFSGSNALDSVAWYGNISDWTMLREVGKQVRPVKRKLANELGLYDMSGNVEEWCSDLYGEHYYDSLPPLVTDPQGPVTGRYHVARGGSWMSDGINCWVTARNSSDGKESFSTGFRLVVTM